MTSYSHDHRVSGVRRPRSPGLVILIAATTAALSVVGARSADAVGRVVDVYPGTGTLQAAADAAVPGDTLALHTGTYVGQVVVRHSGTAVAPITIKPAGDGPVTVTADFPSVPCNNMGPVAARTLKFLDGTDYWTVSGLRIVNGIWVTGLNGHAAGLWFKARVQAHDWQSRRALPGRGSNDPTAAEGIYAALSTKINMVVDPAEGLRFLNNDISGRGIHVIAGRRGEIGGNTIHDVACGIGPGVWVNVFSDFWRIHHNTVRNVGASTYLHYMQEGIRLGTASDYNLEEYNTVTDLPGDGRAVTTDRDASWNTFQYNNVARVRIGYNDQEAGWGNRWVRNTATAVTGVGFSFRGADANLKQPSFDRSTNMAYVACNHVDTMGAGTLMKSTFVTNYFKTVNLSPNLRAYWTSAGNTWNGSSAPPPPTPPQPAAGSC